MRTRDGQKPIARHFQSQVEGRQQLDAGRAAEVGTKKELDTVSVVLQLSKYEEA
jgi:hypothetical protein